MQWLFICLLQHKHTQLLSCRACQHIITEQNIITRKNPGTHIYNPADLNKNMPVFANQTGRNCFSHPDAVQLVHELLPNYKQRNGVRFCRAAIRTLSRMDSFKMKWKKLQRQQGFQGTANQNVSNALRFDPSRFATSTAIVRRRNIQ